LARTFADHVVVRHLDFDVPPMEILTSVEMP